MQQGLGTACPLHPPTLRMPRQALLPLAPTQPYGRQDGRLSPGCSYSSTSHTMIAMAEKKPRKPRAAGIPIASADTQLQHPRPCRNQTRKPGLDPERQ